jgi:hypothetical protein
MAGQQDYKKALRQLAIQADREADAARAAFYAEMKTKMTAIASSYNSKAASLARANGVEAKAEFVARSLMPVSKEWTVSTVRGALFL